MNDKMKNIAIVLFLAWFALAIVLVLVSLIIGTHDLAVKLYTFIMSSFFLFPFPVLIYRFLNWAINFLTSINTNLKDRINPFATMNDLIESDKRKKNVGFYIVLFIIEFIVNLSIALLWLIFTEVSYNAVYAVIHTAEYLITGQISFVALLFYLLITIGYFAFVWWFLGQILNGRLYTNTGNFDISQLWKIILMIIFFYSKIIISGLLLKYTIQMIISALIFWTVVIGVPILFLKTCKLFKILYKILYNKLRIQKGG